MLIARCWPCIYLKRIYFDSNLSVICIQYFIINLFSRRHIPTGLNTWLIGSVASSQQLLKLWIRHQSWPFWNFIPSPFYHLSLSCWRGWNWALEAAGVSLLISVTPNTNYVTPISVFFLLFYVTLFHPPLLQRSTSGVTFYLRDSENYLFHIKHMGRLALLLNATPCNNYYL